ncbi:MAG: peptidoglycan editing factor PgeF [Rudaea sp.]
MRRIDRTGAVFYVSDALGEFPNVVHAVTTRHGGVSEPPFNTLNLGSFVGDTAENVRENHERVHAALGLDPGSTVDARQAQASAVARVGASEHGTRIQNVDALITDVPGLPLLLRFADCVPILFYDPTHRAIGLSHAGWRGTVAKVVSNTVREMQSVFRTEPADLYAVIGPSIGPCCYTVGPDVQEQVRTSFPHVPGILGRQNGTTHLDLWEANALQLRELGVENIEISGLCTSDRTDEWYSWRREKGRTGRFAAIIALKD